MSLPPDQLVPLERVVTATLVTDVQLAPDGSRVAYVTSPASKEGEHPVATIWLVDAAGGPSRRLTTSECLDASPRWSPDGARIAFVSDRLQRGTPQLYLLDLAGGEAVRLTDREGGVGTLRWSPDGRRIAFTSRDDEPAATKARKEAGDDTVVPDRDVRHNGLWVLDVPADPAAVTPAALPTPRRLSPEGRSVSGELQAAFSWSPDASAVIGCLAASPKAHDTFAPELVIFPLDGEPQSLGRFEGLLSTPAFSPDGSTIAFVAAEERIPALFSLHTIPAAGGAASPVLPGYEGSFGGFCWLPDGDRLLASVEERQSHVLRVVDPESREASHAIAPLPSGSGGPAAAPSLSADGTRVAFARGDATSLPDVWVSDLDGEPRRLTDLNPWVRDYQWGETREVRWTSFDGLEIEGLLILPASYQPGTRYPTLLHIHGGPCAAWLMELYANWHDWGQLLAQRGYAVLLPNPRGSSGRGTEFLCGITGCYGEPDWQDLITGVDWLIEQGIADPDQLVVGGWSGGGFLTNWTITHSDRFRAAISGAGISNWVSFQGTADVRSVFDRYLGAVDADPDTHWRLSPIRQIANATTPTLILYGEADQRVPVSQGYELYEGLKSRGVETTLVAYPREPHAIQERKHQLDLLRRVISWYDEHLGRTPVWEAGERVSE